jgi:hypothetical protein
MPEMYGPEMWSAVRTVRPDLRAFDVSGYLNEPEASQGFVATRLCLFSVRGSREEGVTYFSI